MTLFELVKYLRKNILYDTGGQGVQWENFVETDYDSVQLRWNNEELVDNINEAVNQVYRRTNPIKDIYLLKVKTGIRDYTLPSYIKKLISCRRADGKVLEEKGLEDYFSIDNFDTKTGDLEKFITDGETNKIRIYPIPVADETISFFVYRYPITKLAWDDYDISPEIKEAYQIPMLFYAAYLCYNKDEVNTYDPTRADKMLSYFDREFPYTSVYSDIRKSRTANRSIKYGGL